MSFPAANWTMRMNCRFQLLVRCQTRMILNAVGRLAVLSAHLWAVFYSLWHKNSSGYSVSGSPCAASILHKSLRLSQQTFFIFGQEIWKYEKSQACIRLLCFPSKPYLLFFSLLILQFEKGKMAISVKKSRKMPRLKLRCRVICRGITLWIYFCWAIFRYSIGRRPVLLRNNSANRLEVE